MKNITLFLIVTLCLPLTASVAQRHIDLDSEYNYGKQLLIRGDYAGAIKIFDKRYRWDDFVFFRGLTRAKLEHYPEAVEALDSFYSSTIGRDSPKFADSVTATCKGLAELGASRFYQAAYSFDRAISGYGSDISWDTETEAKIQEQYKASISDDDRMKELIPDFITAYIGWHTATTRLEKYLAEEHEEYLVLRKDFNSDLSFALNGIVAGIVHAGFGQHARAIKRYNFAIKCKPDLAIAYLGRGYVKTKLELYSDALPDFDKAIELAPNIPLFHYLRGDTKYKLGKPMEAKVDMQNALKLTTIPKSRGAPSSKAVVLTYLIKATTHRQTNKRASKGE